MDKICLIILDDKILAIQSECKFYLVDIKMHLRGDIKFQLINSLLKRPRVRNLRKYWNKIAIVFMLKSL